MRGYRLSAEPKHARNFTETQTRDQMMKHYPLPLAEQCERIVRDRPGRFHSGLEHTAAMGGFQACGSDGVIGLLGLRLRARLSARTGPGVRGRDWLARATAFYAATT